MSVRPHLRHIIIAGDAEYMLDGMRTVRDRLDSEEAMGTERLTSSDATHDFLFMPWHDPERTTAFEKLSQWVLSISSVNEYHLRA